MNVKLFLAVLVSKKATGTLGVELSNNFVQILTSYPSHSKRTDASVFYPGGCSGAESGKRSLANAVLCTDVRSSPCEALGC